MKLNYANSIDACINSAIVNRCLNNNVSCVDCISTILDTYAITIEQVAIAIGASRSYVYNQLTEKRPVTETLKEYLIKVIGFDVIGVFQENKEASHA